MKYLIELIKEKMNKMRKNSSEMRKFEKIMKALNFVKSIVLFLLIVFASTSCKLVAVQGNGQISEIEKKTSNFNKIDASGSFDINVKLGKESKIKIIADKNLQKYITTKVVNNTLYLSTKKNLSPTNEIEIFLITPQLVAANISGSNDLKIHNYQGQILKLEISGAGTFYGSGKVDVFDVEISGAGELKAEKLVTKVSKIQISGAGEGIINVKDELYAEVSGAGDLLYIGNPKIIKTDISGAGSIKKKTKD